MGSAASAGHAHARRVLQSVACGLNRLNKLRRSCRRGRRGREIARTLRNTAVYHGRDVVSSTLASNGASTRAPRVARRLNRAEYSALRPRRRGVVGEGEDNR